MSTSNYVLICIRIFLRNI